MSSFNVWDPFSKYEHEVAAQIYSYFIQVFNEVKKLRIHRFVVHIESNRKQGWKYLNVDANQDKTGEEYRCECQRDSFKTEKGGHVASYPVTVHVLIKCPILCFTLGGL
mgnify:CR=1 FL=1